LLQVLPFFRQRFAILFLSLVAVAVIQPVVQQEWGDRLLSVLSIFVLVATIYSVCRRGWEKLLTAVLVLPLIIIAVLGTAALPAWGVVSIAYIYIAFLTYTVIAILRHVLSEQAVTSNIVFASLCAYILLGYIWALTYVVIDYHVPGSFLMRGEPLTMHGVTISNDLAYFIYYSFVTLATLGYGDIIPVTQVAQMVSAFEAIIGQLFLVVLVARMVGVRISQRR